MGHSIVSVPPPESAAWFRLVLDSLSEFVLVKGARSKLLWANRAFRDYYGLSNAQLRELIDSEHSDPDDTLQYVRDDHQVFTTGEMVEVAEPVTRHDGEVGYFRTIKTPLRVDERIVGTVGTSRPERDAASQEASEANREARKDSSAMLRELVRSLPACAVVLDAKSRVVASTTRFDRTFGVETHAGAFFDDVLSGRVPLAPELEEAISRGASSDDLERSLSDGRSFLVAVRPWFLPNASTAGALVMFNDVTQERRAEAALIASNDNLRNANDNIESSRGELEGILASLAVGTIVVDASGRVTRSNDEAHALLGTTELGGDLDTWLEHSGLLDEDETPLLGPASPPAVALSGGIVRDRWIRLRRPDAASDRWLSVSAAPILDSSRAAAVMTLSDVTQRQRNQRELEEFAYVASHDLQEPLRMVRSFMTLLDEEYADKLDETGRQYVNFAKDGAERMSGLVRELLEFSRAGGATLELGDVELGPLMATVVTEFTPRAEASGGHIAVDPLPKVSADPSQLRQVFANLISNGLKFKHPERPPQVHVAAHDLGTAWRIEVQDNGIGLDARYADRVFRMFQRLHPRSEYDGTGIGLAICKRIVERHQGSIGVQSEPGRGSTFWFTLPRGS